jgi:hypothetical protein
VDKAAAIRFPAMADSLEQVLRAPLPPGIAALPEADRAQLAAVVAAARRRQTEDLAASFHATLKHVPFPLRAVIKKVLM